jgi:hypothetical protein
VKTAYNMQKKLKRSINTKESAEKKTQNPPYLRVLGLKSGQKIEIRH